MNVQISAGGAIAAVSRNISQHLWVARFTCETVCHMISVQSPWKHYCINIPALFFLIFCRKHTELIDVNDIKRYFTQVGTFLGLKTPELKNLSQQSLFNLWTVGATTTLRPLRTSSLLLATLSPRNYVYIQLIRKGNRYRRPEFNL